MLAKFGYHDVHEAYDGREAVRVMGELKRGGRGVDVVLMDLWMPEMDGYEATERILELFRTGAGGGDGCGSWKEGAVVPPIVVAVSADVTEKAISRATSVGMEGFMTKPYKLLDLQRLIEAICARMER